MADRLAATAGSRPGGAVGAGYGPRPALLPARGPSGLKLRRGKAGRMGMILVLTIALTSALAPVLAPADPLAQEIAARLGGPSLLHPLGTDALGRDLLSRLLWGGRMAFGLALPAVALGLILGSAIGLLTVWGPWPLRSALLLAIDSLQALPSLLLALLILSLTGPSLAVLILVVALSLTPTYARVMRAQVLGLRDAAFLEAARALGAGPLRLALRHLLPNALGPLLLLAAMDLPGAITLEAGLSFLGLGLPPPAPTWGNMLAEGFGRLRQSPWPLLAPAAALVLTTLGFSLWGEGRGERP